MTIAIYFSIVLVNYLIAVKSKKQNYFILIISLFILGLIFAYGINSVDTIYYLSYYESVFNRSFKDTEIGYYLLVYITRVFNGGYVGMRAATYIIGMSFMYLGIHRMCLNKHFFIVFYCLFLFYIDDIQLRNFISLGIFLFAYSFYVDEDDKYGLLKYILGIGFATLFHTSSIFYLLLLLGKFPYKKLIIRLFVISILFFEAIILINGKRIPFIGTIITSILGDGQRANQYLSTTTNGAFPVVALILLNIWFAYLCWDGVKNCDSNGKILVTSKHILYCSVLQCMWIPMLWVNVEFYRYPRNMLTLNYISFVNYLCVSNNKFTKRKIVVILCYIINLISWLWIAYNKISDWDNIFIPMFYQNGLFN